ncbi:recombinase family protein [Wolbachia endosymbiont (group B) of Tholera decimalis]|uniref:recombinase family protein n=1 Tax=Wolbachia endosymbiont (group B) of Tholera decimalis TaxID=3066181 RepID=UPI00333E5ADC
MTTVSLYARVSSRQQAQENTIESQIVELERRISSDGHELLDEHRFVDNGYSGSNLEPLTLPRKSRQVVKTFFS